MSEDIVYELSSNCRCTVYDSETDSEVLDDNGNPVPSEYCDGCWQDDQSNTEYDIIHPWQEANDIADQDYVVINANRVSWRNVDGYALSKADFKSILKTLTFDGDWKLKITLNADKTMTAQRWSHDEPTGTGIFTFRKATEEEIEDWQRL
jgi:hypothetical protein